MRKSFFLTLASVLACALSGGAATDAVPVQPVQEDRATRKARISLSEAMEMALKHNPYLEVRRESTLAAQSGIREEDAAFDPEIQANVRGSSRREAQASSDLEGSTNPENENVSGGALIEKPLRDGSRVGLEWDYLDRAKSNSSFASLNPAYNSALRITLRKPLLRGSGRENLIPGDEARLSWLRTADEWRGEVESVVAEVERAYWGIAARGHTLEIREQGLKLAKLIEDEAVARESAKVEVLEARANVVRREAEVARAKKELKDARDRLFESLGILGASEPGNFDIDRLPSPSAQVPDAADCYVDALKHGVDARLEENRFARARMDVERARLEMRPRLDLTASGGFLGRDGAYGDSLSAMSQGDGRFVQAGIELRLPWGRRAEKERLYQAESRLRGEVRSIEGARLELFGRLRERCRQVALGLDVRRAAQTSVEVNQARFEEQRARRAAGVVLLRDVLEAQRAMDEAQLAELEARLEILDALIELDILRGALPARHGLTLELIPNSTTPPRT